MVQFGERPIQQNPLEYSGQRDALIPTYDAPRAPTVLDRKYPIQSIWRDNTTNDEWILVDIINGNAHWVLLTGGGFGSVTELRADDGNIAVPNVGIIDVDCNTVAFGTNPTPFYSSAAVANTIDLDVQISTAAVGSDAGNVGVCSFDSAMFTVDANGFVQLAGGGIAVDQINVDANTPPGTDPVLPDGAGQITIAGAAIVAHAVPVETHSRAANAFNIELQVSSAITGAPGNTNDAGICSFDDTMFVVDADGYVQLIGGAVAIDSLTGDDAVAIGADAAGNINLTGIVVANATHAKPIYFVDSGVANTEALNVQVSAAITGAPGDTNDAGICSFDDTTFTVDADGYVQIAGGAIIDQIGVDANTAPGTDPVDPDATGLITAQGAVVAAHSVPLETHSRALNVFNIEVQVASDRTGAPGNKNDAGVCSFNDTHFTVDADGYVSLIGGGAALDSLTGDVGLAVPPDGGGNINLIGTAAQQFIETTGTPASNQIEFKIIEPNGDGELLIGNTAAAAPLVGDITTSTLLRQYSNPDLILDQVSFYQEGHSNFGMTYSGGTLTLHAADGNNLSSTNRGFIRIKSALSRNTFLTFPVTSNYSFDDNASGSSDIAGNLFGTTTGRAWGEPMPFFLYAVLNDAETAVTFMIMRERGRRSCTTSIGKPSSAIADLQYSMWALDDSITVGDWDTNPVVLVGSFVMSKNAGDDWTVLAFGNTGGIGDYKDSGIFSYPPGHNGAVAGSYFSQEGGGGTMPTFQNEASIYSLRPSGDVFFFWSGNNCNGNGVGANNLLIHPPFNDVLGNYYNPPGRFSFLDGGVANRLQYYPYNQATGANYFRLHAYNPAGGAPLTPAGITNADSAFNFTVIYRAMSN